MGAKIYAMGAKITGVGAFLIKQRVKYSETFLDIFVVFLHFHYSFKKYSDNFIIPRNITACQQKTLRNYEGFLYIECGFNSQAYLAE